MNKLFWPILVIIAALAAAYYFFLRPGAAYGKPATVRTTGTATTPMPWWPSWLNSQSLNSTRDTVKTAFSGFSDLSNAFGWNDGGNSNGVSVSGSNSGGAQSSGSGAGVPTNNWYDNWF